MSVNTTGLIGEHISKVDGQGLNYSCRFHMAGSRKYALIRVVQHLGKILLVWKRPMLAQDRPTQR